MFERKEDKRFSEAIKGIKKQIVDIGTMIKGKVFPELQIGVEKKIMKMVAGAFAAGLVAGLVMIVVGKNRGKRKK